MSLNNKVIVVTGASSGIGRACAVELSKMGYHILLNYNSNLDGAKECEKEIMEQDGKCSILQFNVSSKEDIETKLDGFFAENEELSLYGIINNAGIAKDTLTGFMTDEEFTSVIETNLYGYFFLMRWGIKKMLLKKEGVIVNVSSLSGQIGNAGQINYSASKAGILAMTKALSKEVGRRGIRVNAVAPGIIETEMIDKIPHINELKKNIPLKRIGKADEVAKVISFLVSDDSSYITGETISVNGGLYSS